MIIEPLESRIAPATLFALSESNQLLRFDSATPGTIDATLNFTGLGGGETLRGIDFRPETSELFAISVATGSANNSLVHTYAVNTATGALTVVGATAALAGAADVPSGVDFNPSVDRIRYVNSSNENTRINPNLGSLAGNDTDLTYSAPATGPIIAAAYDCNFANTPTTTLFEIDRGASRLVVQGGIDGTGSGGPNGGAITSIGALGVTLSATADGGFDIDNATGTAFAALTANDNVTRLYTIDLATGAATSLGVIGTGATGMRSVSVAPQALAFAAGGKSATYTDQEGDLVTVKVSQGTLDAGNFKMAFKANGGLELHLLSLTGAEFNLADVSILAKKTKAGGDGAVVVGRLDATAVDLGKVTIGGDLAQIDAGDGDPGQPALAALNVHSLGVTNVAARLFVDVNSALVGTLGSLTVKRDIQGATISVNGDIGKVTIGGSLIANDSGIGGSISVAGDVGATKITGSLIGGVTTHSGGLEVVGALTSISVGGSLVGAVGLGSGGITAGSIGKVSIRGSAIGGMGDFSGSLMASGDGGIGDVTITGALASTANSRTGILCEGPLGAVKIGEVSGIASTVPVRISAEGNLNPADTKALAIKSVTIARGVTNALILGGYNTTGAATNPDAQIGTVTVGGDWHASSLVTGATVGTDTFFGNANDLSFTDGAADGVVARISKIVIKGLVAGNYASTDHYGFVAQEIGSLTIGGRKVPLTTGAGNDDLTASNPLFILSASGDVRVHEVAV